MPDFYQSSLSRDVIQSLGELDIKQLMFSYKKQIIENTHTNKDTAGLETDYCYLQRESQLREKQSF